MGLLDGTTQQQYYDGDDHGNYQFVSLTDVINQFMLVYVGEDKIIPKAKRLDVAFHAQRALAELSFDTLKSCKAQEITVPATLQMTLPQDYVNYTKISWVDSAGIKHLMYPTSKTSNPSNPYQDADGNFELRVDVMEKGGDSNLWINVPSSDTSTWEALNASVIPGMKCYFGDDVTTPYFIKTIDHNISGLSFTYVVLEDANGVEYLPPPVDILTGLAYNPDYLFRTLRILTNDGNIHPTYNDSFIGLVELASTFTINPTQDYMIYTQSSDPDLAKIKKGMIVTIDGEEGSAVVTDISLHYNLVSLSDPSYFPTIWIDGSFPDIFGTSTGVAVTFRDNEAESSDTWNNYKSGTPSENQDDYQDDTYWPMDGERYGLDPQHAQANGSFYIDCVSGKIHFSSNISGKTVILDYISDSLGTDEEMQVHKFAEEAIYKWISYAILAGKANVPEYVVQRLKKERFAETRKAKIRLSNLKLEELTQILRGKSKQIKH